MYRFQISANTKPGEYIVLVGSVPELGQWSVQHGIRLQTSRDRYPLWWADVNLQSQGPIRYKYARLLPDGSVEWEAWGSNRWVPMEPSHASNTLVVEDGVMGTILPWPYGYFTQPVIEPPPPKGADGLKVVVLGSSVAMGCSAWLLKGWSYLLGQALNEQYGHQLVNRCQLGTNVNTTIDRFHQVVAPEQPDIVIIALSLGNEGLAFCSPGERRVLQRRFESGLLHLIKMTRELGALPMMGGLYPNGHYTPDHDWFLQDTHRRMLNWGVPVLDWLAEVSDPQGRWKPGISLDPAHPNQAGHQIMFEAIDLNLFNLKPDDLISIRQQSQPREETLVYGDQKGFHVFAYRAEQRVRFTNTSAYSYTIRPSWEGLQTALRNQAGLIPGLYGVQNPTTSSLPCFSVQADGSIETSLTIPPETDIEYVAAFHLFLPNNPQLVFYDGHVGIFRENDRSLQILNETDHEYNIHPMWKEVRRALKGLPCGFYEDPLNPDAPFRTLMIGPDGLESRVKVPGKSSVVFQYKGALSDLNRVAILPLGDRCAVRMMLYKMEYDGPAFPFDLTRTTNLADVADIIENEFYEMWNPQFLTYNAEEKRIYHRKWSGLSFAHEVEDTDDPQHNMIPVFERMRSRYTARSERFWYAIKACDKVLFVRTGGTDRDKVIDLMKKLEYRCQGKPFLLLLLSRQSSEEFADIPNVVHYDAEFNPDRMYENLDHWMHCTEIMQEILESLGISSKNLFWCPPNTPRL
ncbi:MAG: DUF1796 family putative cysteine peptidase [Leptolyngbyaceae cyanobacterium bins.59]|nr:DUF1796 family putative cysteine peptidase [Leptolyngbyaceae cyanobacterium bins.59]